MFIYFKKLFERNKSTAKPSFGFALVEIVIGSAIIVTAILSLISVYNTYLLHALSNSKNIQAGLLLEEGVEAVKFLRDKGWTTYIQPLSSNTTYYLSWNSGLSMWTSSSTPVPYIDNKFLRTFVLEDVKRNGSDQIASSGTTDPGTKKLTVTVAYTTTGSATSTKTMSTYITNLFSN